MQKNVPNNDALNGRGRAIPKNPQSVNKKLVLLKAANPDDRSNNHGFSSRNHP